MMKRNLIIIFLLISLPLYAQNEEDLLAKGIDDFRSGDLRSAITTFMSMRESGKADNLTNYNLLTALTHAQQTQKAEEQLREDFDALATEPSTRAKASYNVGTGYLSTAQQADQQNKLQEAARELQLSVEWLQKSLLDDPQDSDTKNNLELANALMKKLQDQQQENNDQDKDQNKDQQQNDEQDQQEQESDQQKDEQEPQDNDGESEEQQQDQQQQNQQDKQQEQQEREISDATAANLLEAAKNAEKKAMKEMRAKLNKLQRKRAPKGKDW